MKLTRRTDSERQAYRDGHCNALRVWIFRMRADLSLHTDVGPDDEPPGGNFDEFLKEEEESIVPTDKE